MLRERRTAIRRRGLWALIWATLVNVAIYAIGRLVGAPFEVSFGAGEPVQMVSVGQVIFTSVLSLGAGTVLALLVVRSIRSATWVQVVAASIALVSAGAPLSAGVEASTQLLLASMHLVAGTVFVLALQKVKRANPVGEVSAPATPRAEAA